MKKFILALFLLLVLTGLFIFLTRHKKEVITTQQNIRLGNIPEDAEIIFWSTRNIPTAHILAPSNLYVMNQDGGNVTQITFEPKRYEHAAVSPDKNFIVTAFKENNGTNIAEVWIYNIKGQSKYQLVPNFYQAGNGGVDWSINGWIYFRGIEKRSKINKFGVSEVYRIRPDGSNVTHLTDNSEMEVFDVSISPDGTMTTYVGMIRFKNSKGEVCAKPQIWVMNSDGSNHRMVDDGGDECGIDGKFPLGDYDPEISPDNRYVVFSRANTAVQKNYKDTLNTAHDIWIAPIDKSSPAQRITEPGPISIIPDWKDDKILYTEIGEGEYVGLVIIHTNGTQKRRLEQGKHQNILDGGRHGKWLP